MHAHSSQQKTIITHTDRNKHRFPAAAIRPTVTQWGGLFVRSNRILDSDHGSDPVRHCAQTNPHLGHQSMLCLSRRTSRRTQRFPNHVRRDRYDLGTIADCYRTPVPYLHSIKRPGQDLPASMPLQVTFRLIGPGLQCLYFRYTRPITPDRPVLQRLDTQRTACKPLYISARCV